MRIAIAILVAALVLARGLKAQDQSQNTQQQVMRLVAQLGAADFKTRDGATRQLIELGPKAIATVSKVLEHEEPEVRGRAAQILLKIDPRYPPIFALRSVGIEERIAALRKLAGYRDERLVAPLLRLLPEAPIHSARGTDRDYVELLMRVAGRQGDRRLTAPLTKLLLGSTAPAIDSDGCILGALMQIPDPAAAEPLLQYLGAQRLKRFGNQGSPEFAEALGGTGDVRCVSAILDNGRGALRRKFRKPCVGGRAERYYQDRTQSNP
jgi:HEAT repeat protein